MAPLKQSKVARLVQSFSLTVLAFFVFGCGESQTEYEHRRASEKWEAPCQDTATLLATTAGSPDSETCTNKHHRMKVQIATQPSNEEFGALVFCQCEYPIEHADAGRKAGP